MESYLTSSFLLSLLQIVWIDIILSGDNAVVIAMACRGLPERQRRIGVFAGAFAAALLRIVFAVIISQFAGGAPAEGGRWPHPAAYRGQARARRGGG